ncbi:MAG: peptidoglycan DD-metalloendopeptidase family protein [Methylococcales bacterium]|nr:peptidoglycan DD-metalloendopeptidase family protein [Methylococcaceae bacterium]
MKRRVVFLCLLALYQAPANSEVPEPVIELSEADTETAVDDKQKTSLNAQLAEIEKLYGNTAALLRTLNTKAETTNNNLSKIRKELTQLKTEVAKHNKELAGQIKAAHAMGQQEKLKLLLNQKDPALSSRMMVYYGYLNAARISKLNQLNNTLSQLTTLEQRQQEESTSLENVLSQQKSEQLKADDIKEKRANLLAQFSNDYLTNEQQINRLKESERTLKNLIASTDRSSDDSMSAVEWVKEQLHHQTAPPVVNVASAETGESFPVLKGDFSELKGTLPWPVAGQLRNKTGNNAEVAGDGGVLIDAKEGTEIHAVTNGEVVYADWLKDYGMLLIVEHGNDYMTLYAFNQSLYKKVGDKVEAGEIIATVGQSGGRSEPGLYFGIRKKGKPVDPIAWCRR